MPHWITKLLLLPVVAGLTIPLVAAFPVVVWAETGIPHNANISTVTEAGFTVALLLVPRFRGRWFGVGWRRCAVVSRVRISRVCGTLIPFCRSVPGLLLCHGTWLGTCADLRIKGVAKKQPRCKPDAYESSNSQGDRDETSSKVCSILRSLDHLSLAPSENAIPG